MKSALVRFVAAMALSQYAPERGPSCRQCANLSSVGRMGNVSRLWAAIAALFLIFDSAQSACAAEPGLTVVIRGQQRIYRSSELLNHPALKQIDTDACDEAYKGSLRYSAIPIEALLGPLAPEDEVQFSALDGYAPSIPVSRLTGVGNAHAHLAVESPAVPWPALAQGKPSAGPFYLIWSGVSCGRIGPSEWPYQIESIKVEASLASRFPRMAPDPHAAPAILAGFDIFRRDCLPCHGINGQGDGKAGPDLNVPTSPTEYFTDSALRRLIRDPKSVRQWAGGVMPSFDAGRLDDRDLERLVQYLKHMASRRR